MRARFDCRGITSVPLVRARGSRADCPHPSRRIKDQTRECDIDGTRTKVRSIQLFQFFFFFFDFLLYFKANCFRTRVFVKLENSVVVKTVVGLRQYAAMTTLGAILRFCTK